MEPVLKGTVALVTGASSGIGAATAAALADHGAAVALAARRKDRLEALAAGIRDQGGTALVLECDVTDQDQAADMVERTVAELGRLDTLVNHADPPHHADRHRPEIRSLQQAVRNQGYRPDFLRKHGAADGRFYYQRGTDAVIFGVGGDGLHGPDEYAETATIAPYYRALTEFLRHPRLQ